MELKKITEKAKLLSSLPIYIDDTPGLTAIQLRARAHRLKALEPELGLIVIDYLQLMHSGTKADNRQQEVTEVTLWQTKKKKPKRQPTTQPLQGK